MSPNKDKTGNERQHRRRQREKAWLKENGFESWEALHTALMNGTTRLTQRAADGVCRCTPANPKVARAYSSPFCQFCGKPRR